MEILTPQTIWKGYDSQTLPLATNIIQETQNDGIKQVRAYFNGPLSTDGVARVYVRAYIPQKPNPPVVIYLPDVAFSCDSIIVTEYIQQGYAVIVPDLAGERDDNPYYTIYPESLCDANFKPECLSELPNNVLSSPWIIWTQIAMRTITFAQSLG